MLLAFSVRNSLPRLLSKAGSTGLFSQPGLAHFIFAVAVSILTGLIFELCSCMASHACTGECQLKKKWAHMRIAEGLSH